MTDQEKIKKLEKKIEALENEQALPEDIGEWPGLWRIMCERMFTYSIQIYGCSRSEAAKNSQHLCRKLYEDRIK